MRVLLVQAHLGRIRNRPPLFPLGLCYIANSLAGKHEVQIVDLNHWEFDEALRQMDARIMEFQPEAVGLSLRNLDTTSRQDLFIHYNTVPPTVARIKAAAPSAPLLMGGPGYSLFGKIILERNPAIDFGIHLEGEDATPELLDHLGSPGQVKGIYHRHNGAVAFTGLRPAVNFAALPLLRREGFIDLGPYLDGGPNFNIGLQTKRGCVLHCEYCSYPALTGRALRIRSVTQVADEMEYLLNLGVKQVCLVDNIFNLPTRHAIQICEEIKSRKLSMEWTAWFELKNTDEALLRLAREAGCSGAGFSPDAATNRALKAMHKDIKIDDIERSLRAVKAVPGLTVGYNFFLMYPGWTFGDMLRSILMYFRVFITLPGRASAFLGWVRVEPDTDAFRKSVAEGFVREDTDLLPEDTRNMAKLFYMRKRYAILDTLILWFMKAMEDGAKPIARRLRYLLTHGRSRHSGRSHLKAEA